MGAIIKKIFNPNEAISNGDGGGLSATVVDAQGQALAGTPAPGAALGGGTVITKPSSGITFSFGNAIDNVTANSGKNIYVLIALLILAGLGAWWYFKK